MRSDTLAAGETIGSHSPLRYLPEAIRVDQRPLRAILIGWLTAFPISMALALLGGLLLPDVERPEFKVDGAAALFALVGFAPAVETLIMGVVLLILLLFLPPAGAIFVSALGWGIAHSLIAPVWGLVIWWPFLIFSTLFVAWRKRSLILAFLIPAMVHALQNLFPALLIAYGQSA